MAWKVDWTTTFEAQMAGVETKSLPPEIQAAQKAPEIRAKSLAEKIKSGIVGTAQGIWESISDGWNKVWGWAKANPVKAVAGAVALVAGGILILKAGALAAVLRIGGQIVAKMVGSVPKLLGAIKAGAGLAAGNAALSAGAKLLSQAPKAIASASVSVSGKTFLQKIAGNKLVQLAATASVGEALVGGMHWLARGTMQIWNFNWQESDQSIREEQEAIVNGLAGAGGEAVGQIAGSLLCGGSARMAQVRINIPLVAKIQNLLNEEQKELVQDAIEDLVSLTRAAAKQMAALEIYRNARIWLREAGKRQATGIKELDRALASWGNPGQEAWSFAAEIESRIEKIPNSVIRNFVEEAAEGFGEGCYESILAVR